MTARDPIPSPKYLSAIIGMLEKDDFPKRYCFILTNLCNLACNFCGSERIALPRESYNLVRGSNVFDLLVRTDIADIKNTCDMVHSTLGLDPICSSIPFVVVVSSTSLRHVGLSTHLYR